DRPTLDPGRDPVSDHEGRVVTVLPLELIRKDPGRVKRAAELKGEEAPIDEIVDLDQRWRKVLAQAEDMRAEQKNLSKQYALNKDETALARLKTMADQV